MPRVAAWSAATPLSGSAGAESAFVAPLALLATSLHGVRAHPADAAPMIPLFAVAIAPGVGGRRPASVRPRQQGATGFRPTSTVTLGAFTRDLAVAACPIAPFTVCLATDRGRDCPGTGRERLWPRADVRPALGRRGLSRSALSRWCSVATIAWLVLVLVGAAILFAAEDGASLQVRRTGGARRAVAPAASGLALRTGCFRRGSLRESACCATPPVGWQAGRLASPTR